MFTALCGNERPRPHALQVGWDTLLRPTAAVWTSPPALPEPKRPDLALVEAAADQLAAAGPTRRSWPEAAHSARARLSSRWPSGSARPVLMTTEGKRCDSRVASARPVDAGRAIAVRCGRRDSRHRVAGAPVRRAAPVPPGADVIRIDVDPAELDESVKPSIAIEADAREALISLLDAIDTAPPSPAGVAERTAAIAPLKQKLRDGLAARFRRARAVLRAAAAAIPAGRRARRRDDASRLLPAIRLSRGGAGRVPRSGYQGTLGFGYTTALGAKVGVGDRPVVSVSGDGGFLYNVGELATAAQHDIGVVAVVFRDEHVRQRAAHAAGEHGPRDRVPAAEPRSRQLAESFGVAGHRVTELGELRGTLDARSPRVAPRSSTCPSDPSPTCGAS